LYYNIVKMKRFILLFIPFLFINSIIAQTVNSLSRQDSALIIKYSTKAEEFKKQQNYKESSRNLNKVAMIYWDHNYLQNALDYYKKSLQMNDKLANRNAIAMINSNIALILADLKKYDEALKYFEKTYVVRKTKDEKIGMIAALKNMSVVLNNLKRYDDAVKKLTLALDYAREMNDTKEMRSCYGMLSETYQKAGNYKKSMYYFDYYKSFNKLVQGEKVKEVTQNLMAERLKKQLLKEKAVSDSLELILKQREIYKKQQEIAQKDSTNKKILKNMSKKELQLEVLKRDALIKDIKVNQAEESKKKTQIISLIIIISVIILGAVIFYAYLLKRKDNKKLSEQNAKIMQQREEIITQNEELERVSSIIKAVNDKLTSSIAYAEHIQKAMLSRSVPLIEMVSDAFTFFRPRDIVSGDFYYHAKIGNKVIVTAADCTGHGVPGAFLSMIGNNILTQIIEYGNITRPDLILKELDKGVRYSLNQEYTQNRDGMDIALYCIDYDQKVIQFAGAGNPLIYFKNGEQFMIKSSPVAIGGYYKEDKEKNFILQEIPFEENDDIELYVFSDGFIDQFNNDDKKRFTRKRFKETLEGIYQLPFEKQQDKMAEIFDKWKGSNSQLDDVLVIGAKI